MRRTQTSTFTFDEFPQHPHLTSTFFSYLSDRVHLVRQDAPFPFNSVREGLMIVNKVVRNTPHPPTARLSDDHSKFIIKRFVIDLESLRAGIDRQLNAVTAEVGKFVNRDLFNDIWDMCDKVTNPDTQTNIHDDLFSTTVGYNPITDKSSPLYPFQERLVRHVMRPDVNTIFGRRPLYTFAGGVISFNLDEVNEFFHELDLLTEVCCAFPFSILFTHIYQSLCGLVEMLCGAPFRAPELAVTTRCLHPDGVRNQSFINNRVAFISSYLKSRWRSASDACIPKPVPPRLSRLILVVETAILPLANLLIHVRFPLETNPEVRANYKNFSFVKAGEPYNRDRVSRALQLTTEKVLGFKLGLNPYRQLMKAIFTNFSSFDLPALHEALDGDPYDDDDEDEVDPVHSVFGHSAATGEANYAIMDTSAPTPRLTQFQNNLEIAYWMHDFLGVGRPGIKHNRNGTLVCVPSQTGVIDELSSVRHLFRCPRSCTFVNLSPFSALLVALPTT